VTDHRRRLAAQGRRAVRVNRAIPQVSGTYIERRRSRVLLPTLSFCQRSAMPRWPTAAHSCQAQRRVPFGYGPIAASCLSASPAGRRLEHADLPLGALRPPAHGSPLSRERLLPARQCAPVLAAVKQTALDGSCGPALVKGAGNDLEIGWLWRRRVVGGGSGK
jgi:hypothetical protein